MQEPNDDRTKQKRLRTAVLDSATATFFSKLPFAQRYLISNHYCCVPFTARSQHQRGTSNSFFSNTINTKSTIVRAMAVLDRKVLNLKSTLELNQETHLFAPEDTNEPACILFEQLGNGLNGFEGTVHGGVIASLIDESLSLCVESFRAGLSQENAPLYTAKLAILYRKPVQSPNIISVKTWLQKKEGRKWYLKGELVTEDGQVRAVAESLWISARKESAL